MFRELQWPVETTADVAQFLMEVEEEGAETEFLPENKRARLVGIEADPEARTGLLHAARGVGENVTHHRSLRDWSGTGDWNEGSSKFTEDSISW